MKNKFVFDGLFMDEFYKVLKYDVKFINFEREFLCVV